MLFIFPPHVVQKLYNESCPLFAVYKPQKRFSTFNSVQFSPEKMFSYKMGINTYMKKNKKTICVTSIVAGKQIILIEGENFLAVFLE